MTQKQKLFVKEYLVDLNATRAAISAGYSEKNAESIGCRLSRNVKVRSEIDRQMAERVEKLDISADYVLRTIKQTVERCSQAIEVFDREGKPTGEWKEDSFAVLKGCELLGKHLKLFTEKVEHSGNIEHANRDYSQLTTEQLEEADRLIESSLSARSDPG